jgi:hypothetical protein
MRLDVLKHVLFVQRLALLLLDVREVGPLLDPRANDADLVLGEEARLLGHILEHADAVPEIGVVQVARRDVTAGDQRVANQHVQPAASFLTPWQR